MSQYFTIGMAGHIDHGKTTLTKALTGVDTDRLKEEKERNISIEPGFAPFINNEHMEVSIIDVPGHERFIRQMIAGVAGIDMVILVIAADEGVMPQTKEHLDILSLLGIEDGFIVMTKIDRTDEELRDIVIDDTKETMKGTFLEDAPIYMVDSLSNKGVSELREALINTLHQLIKKDQKSSFRLPIDQVFTVKGQGVVVRGTVYDGALKQGESLKILPLDKEVRVRQIQRHHEQKTFVSAGQRTAINISGVSHNSVSRGEVLVADDFYSVSNRIDVAFYPLKDVKYKIKQRQPIKLFIGTSEVMGKLIFYDRNEVKVNDGQEILCQIQLEEEVVVTRGDRYILRKPTPIETMGGGWVIESEANKHRFGQATIDELMLKKEGSSTDRVESLLKEKLALTREDILKQASISEEEWNEVSADLLKIENGFFVLPSTFNQTKEDIIELLEGFHLRLPMRIGINKAEIISELKHRYPVIMLEDAIKSLHKADEVKVMDQYISLVDETPSLPPQYKVRLENVEKELREQGLEVGYWNELIKQHHIPQDLQSEFYNYLIETNRAYILDDGRLITKYAVDEACSKLEAHTNLEDFTLQIARDALQLTRKNLVPLLELFDRLGYTKRVDNKRKWDGGTGTASH